jgi:hypothetical protein
MKDYTLKLGSYAPRIHWVDRGTGTPKDRHRSPHTRCPSISKHSDLQTPAGVWRLECGDPNQTGVWISDLRTPAIHTFSELRYLSPLFVLSSVKLLCPHRFSSIFHLLPPLSSPPFLLFAHSTIPTHHRHPEPGLRLSHQFGDDVLFFFGDTGREYSTESPTISSGRSSALRTSRCPVMGEGCHGVKSTNNDTPTVKFLLCYTGGGCGQGWE